MGRTILKKAVLVAFALVPSRLKIVLLNRLGHEVHPTAKIGMAYLDVKRLRLCAHTQIASFNYFSGLVSLELEENARIGGMWNWFTASALHDQGQVDFGCMTLGKGTNITSRHFFDLQRPIRVGSNTLIAGFGSEFWTHGYRGHDRRKDNRISIGSNCYIGSRVVFAPGARIGDNTIVGAGAVVAGDRSRDTNCLLIGNPASVRKRYEDGDELFHRAPDGFRPTPAKNC